MRDLDLDRYSLLSTIDQPQLIKDVTLDNLRIEWYTISPPSHKALDHQHLNRHLRTCMVIFKEEKDQACFYYFYRDLITVRNDRFKMLKEANLLKHQIEESLLIGSERAGLENSLSEIQSSLEKEIFHIHIRMCNLEKQLQKTRYTNCWSCTPKDITEYLQVINSSSKKFQQEMSLLISFLEAKFLVGNYNYHACKFAFECPCRNC